MSLVRSMIQKRNEVWKRAVEAHKLNLITSEELAVRKAKIWGPY